MHIKTKKKNCNFSIFLTFFTQGEVYFLAFANKQAYCLSTLPNAAADKWLSLLSNDVTVLGYKR